VQVTFDSTGLANGDVLEANLCLQSNDPNRPLVVVPVTLVVEADETPVIEVSPGALELEVTQGGTASESLSIANVGEGVLDWTIHEAEPAGSVASVLYDSGPFVTHPGAGPGGSDHSTLQVASLGMLTLGANVSQVDGARIADRFTVDEAG